MLVDIFGNVLLLKHKFILITKVIKTILEPGIEPAARFIRTCRGPPTYRANINVILARIYYNNICF